MSHPDPNAPADLTPLRPGDTLVNPVTKEEATLVEAPWSNPEGRLIAELTALPGARVAGEHRHPAITETFTIPPNTWHDWWNATDQDVRVTVEVTPGERFVHMIETLFGLGRSGHTNGSGLPHPLQLALFAPEFQDVIVLRKPPLPVQRVAFGALGPLARALGYRATYPQFSRSVLAPRD
jgi:hypothetical protein